jgi:pimeloyl-ACP methyl ester carboxylesterase
VKPTVVLLHGLWRTARSMARLARVIEAEGYTTFARSYASTRQSIEESAADIADELVATFGDRPLVLVTHSLGGILARYIAGPLAARSGLDVRGVVMLAPPNAGSRLAKRFGAWRAFHRLYGPAAGQLGAPRDWPTPDVPVAVIAGTRSVGVNPTTWIARGLGMIGKDEISDGTVLLDETHLPGMIDFQTVAAGHTFIMDHPDVQAMVLRFLREGKLR